MNLNAQNYLVKNAPARTHLRLPAQQLAEKLGEVAPTEVNQDDLVVLSTRDGSFHLVDGDSAKTGPEEVVLPLRFGPLNQALETIEAKQGWLLSYEPVFKAERGGDARIDFINMGGFVFDPAGGYRSHSVNAW